MLRAAPNRHVFGSFDAGFSSANYSFSSPVYFSLLVRVLLSATISTSVHHRLAIQPAPLNLAPNLRKPTLNLSSSKGQNLPLNGSHHVWLVLQLPEPKIRKATTSVRMQMKLHASDMVPGFWAPRTKSLTIHLRLWKNTIRRAAVSFASGAAFLVPGPVSPAATREMRPPSGRSHSNPLILASVWFQLRPHPVLYRPLML
jgi:hypothetical protein